MATNKLLPFANGVGANVTDYDTWSALATLLSQGFTTGVARSDYANRVFAQGALASYILGQFVVDQTAQDADLNESVFYTNFKNALVSYIKANAVSLDTIQTVGGVKTFSSSPIVPTADAADNSQKVANTAFVQGEIAPKANASEVVKLTGNQTIAGVKTFSDSPEVPTPASGNDSQKVASTGFVQNAISSQAVKFDSAQSLTDAEKTQARTNIAAASDGEVVKITAQTLTDAQKTQARSNIGAPSSADLTGKADTDLSNVPASKGILTESYKNGDSWYRVYSDGWCEQGGYISTSSTTTVTLLKAYANTSYFLAAQKSATGSGYPAVVNNKTTSAFVVDPGYGGSGSPFMWYACGYIH